MLYVDRVGGSPSEMSSLLVHFCAQVPSVDVLPWLAQAERVGQDHGDGSLSGPGDYHLHRAQHTLHGTGALPHDRRLQQDAFRRQPGE